MVVHASPTCRFDPQGSGEYGEPEVARPAPESSDRRVQMHVAQLYDGFTLHGAHEYFNGLSVFRPVFLLKSAIIQFRSRQISSPPRNGRKYLWGPIVVPFVYPRLQKIGSGLIES